MKIILLLYSVLATSFIPQLIPANRPTFDRNFYQLPGTPYFDHGYEWWWYSFVAQNQRTGELRPFYIQYFVMNPGLALKEGLDQARFGEHPAYSKVVAGTWGKECAQSQSFYPVTSFHASTEKLEVHIANNRADERNLKGGIFVGKDGSTIHPHRTFDSGSLEWDLQIQRDVSFSFGYATSRLLQRSGAFQMLWDVPGMKSSYSGSVIWNEEVYDVMPKTSFGYQDKNWGADYAKSWIWLSCNHFRSVQSNSEQPSASLVVGGGQPTFLGQSLGEKVLVGFNYQGKFFEWNFTNLLNSPKQRINMSENPTQIVWDISIENLLHRIDIQFVAEKSEMLQLYYENPNGIHKPESLWNAGTAQGTVQFFKKQGLSKWILVDSLEGTWGAGEYAIP